MIPRLKILKWPQKSQALLRFFFSTNSNIHIGSWCHYSKHNSNTGNTHIHNYRSGWAVSGDGVCMFLSGCFLSITYYYFTHISCQTHTKFCHSRERTADDMLHSFGRLLRTFPFKHLIGYFLLFDRQWCEFKCCCYVKNNLWSSYTHSSKNFIFHVYYVCQCVSIESIPYRFW